MRTRQEGGKRWQDSSNQQEMFIKKEKRKKTTVASEQVFLIRILGIKAIMSGYFKNCKVKKPLIKRQICVKNLCF